MNYKILNIDWGAEPNAPQPKLSVDGNRISIKFLLNPFNYDTIEDDEKGELTFINCHKYSFNNCNDEGYYRGQYRYKSSQLPWGEFYELQTNWKKDLYPDSIILNEVIDENDLKHYIFFLRDNILECIAEGCEFRYLKNRITQAQ